MARFETPWSTSARALLLVVAAGCGGHGAAATSIASRIASAASTRSAPPLGAAAERRFRRAQAAFVSARGRKTDRFRSCEAAAQSPAGSGKVFADCLRRATLPVKTTAATVRRVVLRLASQATTGECREGLRTYARKVAGYQRLIDRFLAADARAPSDRQQGTLAFRIARRLQAGLVSAPDLATRPCFPAY